MQRCTETKPSIQARIFALPIYFILILFSTPGFSYSTNFPHFHLFRHQPNSANPLLQPQTQTRLHYRSSVSAENLYSGPILPSPTTTLSLVILPRWQRTVVQTVAAINRYRALLQFVRDATNTKYYYFSSRNGNSRNYAARYKTI